MGRSKNNTVMLHMSGDEHVVFLDAKDKLELTFVAMARRAVATTYYVRKSLDDNGGEFGIAIDRDPETFEEIVWSDQRELKGGRHQRTGLDFGSTTLSELSYLMIHIDERDSKSRMTRIAIKFMLEVLRELRNDGSEAVFLRDGALEPLPFEYLVKTLRTKKEEGRSPTKRELGEDTLVGVPISFFERDVIEKLKKRYRLSGYTELVRRAIEIAHAIHVRSAKESESFGSTTMACKRFVPISLIPYDWTPVPRDIKKGFPLHPGVIEKADKLKEMLKLKGRAEVVRHAIKLLMKIGDRLKGSKKRLIAFRGNDEIMPIPFDLILPSYD